MKIVVLDGETLNGPALSWARIRDAASAFDFYPRSNRAQTLQRAQGAAILLTNKTVLDAAILSQLPDLRYIGVLATGTNVVDIEYAQQKGIVVTNIPGYSTASVAQHVFALILELCNATGLHNHAVHDGHWQASPDFSFTLQQLTELDGLTMGIVGFGAIGQRVAQIANAFGMRVIVHSRTPKPGAEFVAMESLLEQADVLSLHCPLTPATESLINRDSLRRMRPSALLINTGRGQLIDETALAEALQQGIIAGAALDVLRKEPPTEGSPLIGCPRCIITPHIAWATTAAKQRLLSIAADNITAFLANTRNSGQRFETFEH